MKSDKLKNQILDIFEEIKQDTQSELQLEGLSGAYAKLAKFLLQQVKGGKFLRNYDTSSNLELEAVQKADFFLDNLI